jgi:uncharacterized protein (DUF58 family)
MGGVTKRRAGPRAPRRVALTGRGVALLAVGLALLAAAQRFERSDALLVGAALAAAPLASFLMAMAERPRPRYARSVPSHLVHEGETIAVLLQAGPGRRRAPRDFVVDLTPSGAVEAVPQGPDGRRLAYQLPLDRRGTYEIGPAISRRVVPMGLARSDHVLAVPTPVAVAPRLHQLAIPRLHQDAAEAGAGRRLTAERVPDPATVRDYRPGDTRRMVHWRATLRRNRLMVRGDAPRAVGEVWLVVDTVRPRQLPHGARQADAFEDGLAIAASLAVRFLRMGNRLRIAETGPRQFPGEPGAAARFEPTGGAEPVLRAFAALEPQADDAAGWADQVAGGLAGRGEPVPIFLVFADVTAGRARAAAVLRPLADPAQAYLVGPGADPLRAAGWGVSRPLGGPAAAP